MMSVGLTRGWTNMATAVRRPVQRVYMKKIAMLS